MAISQGLPEANSMVQMVAAAYWHVAPKTRNPGVSRVWAQSCSSALQRQLKADRPQSRKQDELSLVGLHDTQVSEMTGHDTDYTGPAAFSSPLCA